MQPRDDLDEGRLAGAVVAEHARHLALADVHRDPAQGVDVAIGLAHVVHDEQGRGVGGVAGDPVLDRSTHDASAFFLTYMLTSVAAMSMTPRKVLSQSTSHPA